MIDIAIIASLKPLIAWVEPLANNTITASRSPAVIGAGIGIDLVPIIATLAEIEPSITTGLYATGGGAAIATLKIPIITRLAGIDSVVTADL